MHPGLFRTRYYRMAIQNYLLGPPGSHGCALVAVIVHEMTGPGVASS